MVKKPLVGFLLALWMSVPVSAANNQTWRAAVGKPRYVWLDPKKPNTKCEIVAGRSGRIEDPCKLIYLQCGERWRVKIYGLMTGPVF